MRAVNLGGPIALIVLGLILALAVSDRISGVDLGLIGWILAAAGAIWLVLSLVLARPRTSVTEVRETRGDQGVHRQEYRDDI
jgi:heme A synthase